MVKKHAAWLPSDAEIKKLLLQAAAQEIDAQSMDFLHWSRKLETHYRNLWLKNNLRKLLSRQTKSVDNVAADYGDIWRTDQYPGSPETEYIKQRLLWGSRVFDVRGFVEKKIFMLFFYKAFQEFKPKTVVELGCGAGGVAFYLAGMFPQANFIGIDLTAEGIAAAKKMQVRDSLPEFMKMYSPRPVTDPNAFKRVDFRQGNAAQTDLPDKSVDLVYTSLALEQMNAVQEQVLTEIKRICKGHVVMIEPFPDFNRSALRKLYTKSRDYFSVPVHRLSSYGLEPILTTDHIPSKVFRGAGLVVTKS